MKKLFTLIAILFLFSACQDKIDLNSENELLLGDWVQVGFTSDKSVKDFLSGDSDTIVYDFIKNSPFRMTVSIKDIFFYNKLEGFRVGRSYDYLAGYKYWADTEHYLRFGTEHRDIRYLSEAEAVFLYPISNGVWSFPIYRKIVEVDNEN